jgi:hypothetical protein
MSDDPARELKARLEELESLAKRDTTRKTLYNSFAALTHLGSEGIRAKFRPGWASSLKASNGSLLFTRDEARNVEKLATTFLKPAVQEKAQRGGAMPDLPALVPSAAQGLLQYAPTIDLKEISLDKTFWKIKKYIEQMEEQTHTLAREIGPFRFFYESPVDIKVPLPVPIPAPPFVAIVPVPVPSRAIPFLIGLLAEAVRLMVAFNPLAPKIARELLSVVVGLIDLMKGEWKQAILSFAGYFGFTPMLLGILGKVVLNLMSMVAPDIQERLIVDLYQSYKSFTIGVVLWAFATLAPDFVRTIVRRQFDLIKTLVDNTNQQIQKVEGAIQQTVEPAGIKINFKEIPENWVPSFDDIQNLQSIVRQPGIYCSAEFQSLIEPLKVIPPIRMFLELLNIPTDEDTAAALCAGVEGMPILQTMKAAVMPEVTIDPNSPLGASMGGISATAAQAKALAEEGVAEAAPEAAIPVAEAEEAPKQMGGRREKTGRYRIKRRYTRRK